MAGRERTPREISKADQYRDVTTYLNRIQRAKIKSVDTKKGVCSLEFEATPSERSNVTIPMQYASFASSTATRIKSAWRRYMPQVGDIVLVGFDSNASPRILGYDVVSYELISQIQTEEGFGWVELKSGEFDERSSGGAYLRGTVDGTLFLAGGLSAITLNKKRYEITKRSGLEKLSAGASVFRSGIVKRSPIPFAAEAEAKLDVGIPPTATPVTAALPNVYEHTIDLWSPTPGVPFGRPMLFFSMGNVMDPDIDAVSPTGSGPWGVAGPAGIKKFKINPLVNARFFMRVYDSLKDVQVGSPGPIGGTPARPFEWGIDALGNSYMNISAAAVQGFNVYSPTSISLSSNLLSLSGNIYLGGAFVPGAPSAPTLANKAQALAGGPAVCGTLFTTALAPFLTAVAALAAAAAAGSAVSTPADAVGFCKALGAAAAVATPAIATFAGSFALWLSNTVFIAAPTPPGPAVLPPLSPFLL